jgi:CRISPR-associated endonuclease/helicase Cas3
VAQPYDQEPVSQSVDALRALEAQEVTPASMQANGPTSKVPARHVLRRRDLLELFDTLPDLSGADTDVSRFIREAEDTDVEVAWRELATTGERRGPGDDEALPAYEERCRVPLGRARQWLRELEKSHKALEVAWRVDHLSTGRDWVRCGPEDLRPGLVLIVPASLGGYEPGTGWLASSKAAVQVVGVPGGAEGLGATDLSTTAEDLSTSADPGTCASEWQSLYDHLCDTKKAAEDLLGLLCGEGSGATLRQQHKQAIVKAAAIHDIGKAHPVFQASLEQLAQEDADGERAALVERPWAKSGLKARLRHSRRWFRHELASALAVLQAAQVGVEWLADEATDLVAYLVASHHGRARLGFRSLPGEEGDGLGEHLCALGVRDGDLLPEVRTPLGTVPALSLSLSPMLLGRGTDGGSSWSARMLALRDNPDLGPFRLGFAESVVRLADWRASAAVAAAGRSATRLEVKGAL